MSDKPTDADPMLTYLCRRREELESIMEDCKSRINEIDQAVKQIADGRSSVSKQRRQRATGNGSKPTDTQPGGYDDSVSIDNARGILRPDADAATEQESVGP